MSYDEISSTINLKSIEEKLVTEFYDNPEQFRDDVKTWFSIHKMDRSNRRSKVTICPTQLLEI